MKNSLAFTLIELLMVIVILSVVVALSAPNFNKSFKNLELKKTAEDIVYTVRWAQSKAIQDNREYRLVFLNNLRSYQILKGDDPLKYGYQKFSPISIRMGRVSAVPQSVVINDAKDLTIYPDGTLDKVRIRLEGQGSKLIISTFEQRGNLFILEEGYES